MPRCIGRAALAVPLLATSFLVSVVAAEWPSGASQTYGLEPLFTRRVLQRNTTTSGSTSPEPARITGILALYSLLGLFVLSSVSTCAIGIVATLQWPNPRICCYRTQYSDIPSSESCGCCALHRLNIGFAVTWMALLVLLVLALIVFLIAVAAVLAILHAAIAYRLIRQLRTSHDARNRAQQQMQMAVVLEAGAAAPVLVTGVPVDHPLPGVPVPGILVVSVPMSVAVVDGQLQTHIGYAADNENGIISSRLRSRNGGASSGRRRSSSSGIDRANNHARRPAAASEAGDGGRAAGAAAATAIGGAEDGQRRDQAVDAPPGAVVPGGAQLWVSPGGDGRPSVPTSPTPPGDARGSAAGVTQHLVEQPQQQLALAPSRGGWLPAGEEAGRATAGSGGSGAGSAGPGGGMLDAAMSPDLGRSPRGGQPDSLSEPAAVEPVGAGPSALAEWRQAAGQELSSGSVRRGG